MTFAIDMMRGQAARVDIVKAVDVDGGHFAAVGQLAIGKALDAAGFAELVTDLFIVEKIFGQVLPAGFQHEIIARGKGQNRSEFLAA